MKQIFLVIIIIAAFLNPVFSLGFDDLKTKGDKYWNNRDQLDSLLKAIDCYKKALEIEPDNTILLNRLSFASFFHGWMLQEPEEDNKKEERKVIFTTGMDYAEKALSISPEDASASMRYLLNKLMYKKEFGPLSVAKMVPEIRDTTEMIMKKDKFLDCGGPQRILANVIVEVPGLLRPAFSLGNLEDAEKMMKEAIDFDKRYILNYVTLADVYMKQKRKKDAKDQLQIAIDYPIDPAYKYAADCRRDKKEAIKKMQECFGK